ncbi:hypothetical protein [Pseudomonas typographi]|uniref:hypothetical protein n=1 Tax=Pseudomonas typographi TaxID=2715964 RepID=UPI0016879A8A|nr:hypothetical protein [Pseudomonas typographi]
MLKIDLSTSGAAVSRAMQHLERQQMPFILALTATRLAQRVKAGSLEVMKQRLDRPTPSTLNTPE